MPEYQHFNGVNYITFDLLEIDDDKAEITVAVSDTGKISVRTFDLYFSKTNRRYFEYGVAYTKIYIDDLRRKTKMTGSISIVIGSWGSYNECNERALGSKWLDLSEYSDWDEIVDELKKEGFELDGIDEELFIQDVEGISDGSVNWDYVNPETLFNTLNESGVLTDDYKYKVFCAFLEVRCFDDFEEKVKSRGDRWDDDINLWSGYDWEDYGKEMLECCGYQIPEHILDFIDLERYGRYCGEEYLQEYSDGLIEIQ